MCNLDKCRICLVDGAKLPIFESNLNEDSLHSKLSQCLKEKIEDMEGYPRNICEKCNNTLHAVYEFITKFKTSCKLLQSGLLDVKEEEVHSGNEASDAQTFDEEFEIKIFKTEPNADCTESLDEVKCISLVCVKNQQESSNFSEIETKLKKLKDINFTKRPARKCVQKTQNKRSSISDDLVEFKEKSLTSNKLKKKILKQPREKKIEKTLEKSKEVLPKLCDICGNTFKSYTKMMEHKQDKHLMEPIKCPQCPQSSHLFTERNLKRHIRAVHSEKKFVCEICKKGFSIKNTLHIHIKTVHTQNKIKTHVCQKCNKRYSVRKALIIHERSAHTGLRPAECTVCGARFYHEVYLKEHMRLHTGETPFKCPICDRGYAQRSNMTSHISHNHRLADLSKEQMKNLHPRWFTYLKS